MTLRRAMSVVGLILLAASIGCGDSSVANYSTTATPTADVETAPAVAPAEPDETATPAENAEPEPAAAEPATDLALATPASPENNVADKASTPTNEPATPAVRPPVRTRDGLLDITFDHLKFDIEKDEKFDPAMITPQLKQLDGQRVRLRGYILPSFQQSGITQFILVRDNMECCFGPGAALYDCVVVEMAPGKSTEFTTYPVAVDGKFTLQNYEDGDGVVRAVFHITAEKVK